MVSRKKMIFAALLSALMLSACTEIENDMGTGNSVLPAAADVLQTDSVPADVPADASPDTLPAADGHEGEAQSAVSETLPAAETEAVQAEATQPPEETGDNALISINEAYETEKADEFEEIEAEIVQSDGSIWDIALTFYETAIDPGETVIPYVTMSPTDAPDLSEIWTSSDESVATVDWLGNITGVAPGKCTVRVKSAACPEVYADVSVTVKGVTEPTYIDGILVVNKSYALPRDYDPGVDPKAQSAFDEMRSAAAADGLNIYISSGYRSYDYQASLYKRYADSSSRAEADRYSARAGHSEHQTGLAFDLNTIDIDFADTDEYVWVKDHCAEYGFIIRYPEGKEDITGYMYEPWHIRYLGIENARKVYESGLTLEEYLGIDSKYDE